MRKILLALLIATLCAPAYADGPKMGKNGGIGSSTSTYSGGEPTGGTYAINGTTGAAVVNSVTATSLVGSNVPCVNLDSTGKLQNGAAQCMATPEMFGAIGNGTADDTTAVQNWANYCTTTGSICAATRGKTYLLNSTITFKAQVADNYAPPYSPPVGQNFVNNRPLNIIGNNAIFKANASMFSVFKFIFNDVLAAEGQFYGSVQGVYIEGNGLATVGMFSSYSFSMRIEHNRIKGVQYGLFFSGYGTQKVTHNQIWAGTGIYGFNGGLNDSEISHNDIYPTSNGTCAQFNQGYTGAGNITYDGGNTCTAMLGTANKGIVVTAQAAPTPTATPGTGGSLSAGTYYYQLTATETESATENYMTAVGSVTVAASGSFTVTPTGPPWGWPATCNVYVGTTTSLVNLATKSGGGNALGVPCGTAITLTAIGGARTPPNTNPVNPALTFRDAEFSAIQSAGWSTVFEIIGNPGGTNVQNVHIDTVHMFSAGGTGMFANIQNAQGVTIANSSLGGDAPYATLTATTLINFGSVNDWNIIANRITNATGGIPVSLTNVTGGVLGDNHFRNVGSPTNNVVVFFNNSTNNIARTNTIINTASYATNSIAESGASPNYNFFYDNNLSTAVAIPTKIGANSVVR